MHAAELSINSQSAATALTAQAEARVMGWENEQQVSALKSQATFFIPDTRQARHHKAVAFNNTILSSERSFKLLEVT